MKAEGGGIWTINVALDQVYSHLYFDTMMFYGGLFMTFFLGYLIRRSPNIRRIMRTIILSFRIHYPKCMIPYLGQYMITLGQLCLMLIWSSILVLIFWYFYCHHEFGGTSDLFDHSREILARSCGVMATIFCGLLLFPVSRCNPILSDCFGISFEGAVKYHRWLGFLFIVFFLIHSIVFIVEFVKSV